MLRLIKKSILLILAIAVLISGYIIFEGYSTYEKAIETTSLTSKIEQIQSGENYTKLNDIPLIYQNAVIAIEDHRFKEHRGFDLVATCRAVLANVVDGELSQGGSTITQQLAKNLYFTQEKHFTRKIAELFVAFELEKNYSKDEILELYINTIYYGKGYYGIAAACEGFYKKKPFELTDYEATYLAGIPNAPSIYSSDRHSQLAKKRQKQVLNAMVKYEYLTQDEAETIFDE